MRYTYLQAPAIALSIHLPPTQEYTWQCKKKELMGILVKKTSNIEKKKPAQEDLVESESATVGLNSALWRVLVEEESS